MNTERTSSSALRSSVSSAQRVSLFSTPRVRVFFAWMAAALALGGLTATASLAGMKSATPSGTGTVLALAAQLRTARLRAATASQHTPSGRALQPRRMLHSGALVARAAAASVVPISGGVQTYDVNNPPPAFRPLIGYGTFPDAKGNGLNNSSTNPPVYISALTPTNLTPVWSADETFLIFSSNRTLTGGVNMDGTNPNGSVGPRFHLWAISVNGGEAFQITTSTGPSGGGEFFPALSQNNLAVAFTSDAQSPGTQNLFAFSFSYSALTAGAAPMDLTPGATNANPPASLTLRGGSAQAPPSEATSAALTGFSTVLRPTFSPNDSQLLVFSAVSTSAADANGGAGHAHLYFLYTSSGGFSNDNNVSYPGKLTDGPSDDTDPAFAPDGSYIAFASTADASGFVRNSNNAFGPNNPSSVQNPADSQSLSAGAAAARSVFLISGGLSSTGVPFGTVPTTSNSNLSGTGGRVTLGPSAGFDDYGPAWSNFANQNQYTNPTSNSAYLAFSRSSASMTAPHGIYYFLAATGVSDPTTEILTPETAGGGTNASIKLNTDDNATETSSAGNVYEDAYPTWSPFLSIFSIAYSSNRTVTYNAPAGGAPVERAASVPDGGTVTNSQDSTQNYSVVAGYAGLLVSQVLNLDPPTLLRFSNNEVVHVQAGTTADPVRGTPNKLAASGGQAVTLTVRLSDRESGIDDNGGPNGGSRVYVQIKDPDSKYQDSQGMEHKVFMKDRRYDAGTQTNHATNDTSSDTANGLLDVYNYALPLSDLYASPYYNPQNERELPTYQRLIYPSYGSAGSYFPMVGKDFVSEVDPRGTHGGQWLADAANNPNNTHLFVGKSAINTTNPYGNFSYPVTGGRATAAYPGTDPAQFIPHGPEYECQVVNPTFDAAGATDTTVADYATPYYLAGVDDQNAFSGGTFGQGGTDRPTADYPVTTNGTTTTHPAEWLQLARVPAVQQDNLGGVLYTVTWKTPLSGSDFYVDVIAYDKATFPIIPGAQNVGGRANWRIYDNVGGFSTNQSIGSNDILVVSDYALGQKFAGTTFGGRNTNQNLVPKLFGTESYITDVDINILPDSVYAGIPTAEADAAGSSTSPARFGFQFNPVVQPFGDETADSLFSPTGTYPGNNEASVVTQNGLGAQSYIDNVINDNTTNTDGSSNVQSQRYSIWRILSRGPVPQSVLNSYLPTPVQQPAIVDAADPTFKDVPAATILSASKCVIWLSPYTGDVLADPGTIDDPGNVGTAGVTNPRQSTTSILTAFAQAGGRLCITGQDVGSTLTQNGTVANSPSATAGSPNFLPDVLNATLVASNSGNNVLAGTDNRITGNPFYDHSNNGTYVTLEGPIQGPNTILMPNYPYQDNLVLGDADYADGGLSQIPSTRIPIPPVGAGTGSSVQGEPDVIGALNGAQVAMTYAGGGTAMVFHDDPYGLPKAGATAGALPNGGTGSRVVYAGIGLEALSQDFYSSASPNPSGGAINPPNPLPLNEIIPTVIPRNPRSGVLHNIVNFLRTGFVSGTITQTAGTGQGGGLGINGVTVYLHPTINPATGAQAVPPSRAAFSALTANGGKFTIAGVEPGTYTLVALKPGFQRAVSNSGISYVVEGDTTATNATLTMTPQQPGSIAGAVHDTAGNLIEGATVTFTSQDNSVTLAATTANGSVPGSTTENYQIQDVPVTTYTATATGPLNSQGLPEYTPATAPDAPNAAGVTVQPNTTLSNVNFTLTAAPASIAGTVTDSVTGKGVPGATVTLTDSNGKVVGTTTSKADGTYSFTGIAAGTAAATFTVSVTASTYAPGSASTPLQAGSVVTGLNVALAGIPSGNIKGTVTDQRTGLPISGATVTFTLTGGAPQTTTTAADGTYTLSAIPTGTYSGVASGPATGQAYQPSPAQNFTVSNGQTTPANFVLVPIIASIRGTVTDSSTGLGLAGVTITVTDGSGNVITTNPAPLTTDGSGNYTATLPPGKYFITASKASYNSQTTAATTFALGATVNVSFSLTSSVGTLGGLVTDQNKTTLVSGATVTAVLAGSKTGITFTTSATPTAGPDGKGNINYSGQLTQGTYTVTVTIGSRTSAAQTVTIVGGKFNRLDFSGANGLAALHTFPAGIQFVSTPYDYSSLGFDGLFGALGSNRSNVAVWNPLTGAYALDPSAPADALRLGVGYWVYLKNPMPVTQQGGMPTGPYVAVSLGQGWNQIGVPSASVSGIAISNLMFDNSTGGMITFAQASGPQYNLVTRPLYGYSAGSYQPLTSTGVLTPWNGYWIYVNAAATLEIPTGVATTTTPPTTTTTPPPP